MPIYDILCEACGHTDEELVSLDDLEAYDYSLKAECPLCREPDVCRRVLLRAPMTRMGGDGSDRQIAAMQKASRERFFKSGEADQVRHKHGSELDDSIRGAAVERIKDAGKT